jgi:hypothetical protein
MSVTAFLIAGGVLLVGGGVVAGSWFATEEDRARARIAEINQEIKNCNTIISSFNNFY